MKKILVSLMLLVMTALSAHAQFEEGGMVCECFIDRA